LAQAAQSTLLARIKGWFPDREFIMRSQGQVRFVRISSSLQMKAAGGAAALAVVWSATMGVAVVSEWNTRTNAAELSARAAKVATAESRVTAYREGLDEVADDLSRRQAFIEDMVEDHLGDMPGAGAVQGVQDSTAETRRTVQKVSAVLPEAVGLAKLEARQLAFVEGLTRLADKRADDAAKAIRTLGLDPATVARLNAQNSAMGGPFEAFGSGNDELDPRFEKLASSLSRMAALERGLEGIPNVLPGRRDMISSPFGYRRDPFTGRAAMHSGLDFRGATGTPIRAAAKGRVAFVGRKGGYGNVIEIRHGNGVMTRYAHMSKFDARVGDRVDAGETIGRIGSTGRSTGPHLHFEVRINHRAVDPRPMLEKGASILGARRVLETGKTGPVAAADQ